MTKNEIKPMPKYFDRYIDLVDNIPLMNAFENSLIQIQSLDVDKLNQIGNKVYTKHKWTIKELIKHISDWERITCYRTLIYARNEVPYIQSFDENYLTTNSKASSSTLENLINELITVRQSTITLFESFDEGDFQKIMLAYKYKISILAMGYNLIGHQIHHLRIIDRLYLPLI